MMNESIEDRMGKYLAGEADIHERELLVKEMEANPALLQQFQTLQKIWQNSQLQTDINWETDKGWNRFLEKTTLEVKVTSLNRTGNFKWALAAVLLIAVGVLFFLWNERKPADYAYDSSGINQIILADESKIYLNEGASVTVHSFKRKRREVDLQGEAYFEVTPDVKRPFHVKAGKTVTEVVGTSFNIHQDDDETTVFVSHGKVIFRAQKLKEEAVALTTGEAAFFRDNRMQRIPNPSPNINAWHSKELTFRNMTLEAIMADVSSFFKYEVAFENEQVKTCPTNATLSFKEPNIESVLNSVLATINASYVMEGQKCTIKGGNCIF